jgi:excisionase family DNA binding protein
MHTEHITDALLLVSQAARLLDTSESTVRYMARRGQLPCTRVGTAGPRLFSRADVEALADARRSTR